MFVIKFRIDKRIVDKLHGNQELWQKKDQNQSSGNMSGYESGGRGFEPGWVQYFGAKIYLNFFRTIFVWVFSNGFLFTKKFIWQH